MKKITCLENIIKQFGLSKSADLLSQETGKYFSAQQINNWRKRGIPYRWQDAVSDVFQIPKSEMRNKSGSDFSSREQITSS